MRAHIRSPQCRGKTALLTRTGHGNFRYAVDMEGYHQRRAGRSITTAARLKKKRPPTEAALACFFVVFVGIECCQSGIA
jgi:hypothetical protein